MSIFQKTTRFFLKQGGLNLRYAITMFVFEIIIGVFGYMYLESYNTREAFYMTMITISTVGYGEVEPLSATGQIFTTILIVVNLGVFAYTASAFSFFIIQGQIFKSMHKQDIRKEIDKLHDHVVVCGYGRYGKEIIHQFELMKMPYVLVEIEKETVKNIEDNWDGMLYIHGDSTSDEVLIQAGTERAKSLVIALHNDTYNLYTVLSARQLNKNINIISRAQDQKAHDKLLLAGANHVVMPKQIGGFYMASLVTKPDAVEFFQFMTTEYNSDISFEEYSYNQLPAKFRDRSLSAVNFRSATGANVVGYKDPMGNYIVNPKPSQKLEKGSAIIVIGSKKQLIRTKKVMEG